jgi:hypothetical protein
VRSPINSRPGRGRRAAVAVILLGVSSLLVTAGSYLARPTSPASDAPPRTAERTERASATRPDVNRPVDAAESITRTETPEAFATSVAEALFSWNTAGPDYLASTVDLLLAVADPTGEATPGLVGDVLNYLPTDEAWTDLREYDTRQWLEVEAAATPDSWSQALDQAGPHDLLPGTTAITIEGIRHREGTWEGNAVSTAHQIAFTVFIVCAPSYPTCRLLRLSLPDRPLE